MPLCGGKILKIKGLVKEREDYDLGEKEKRT